MHLTANSADISNKIAKYVIALQSQEDFNKHLTLSDTHKCYMENPEKQMFIEIL